MRSIVETNLVNYVQENNQTKHKNCISRLQRFGCSGILPKCKYVIIYLQA